MPIDLAQGRVLAFTAGKRQYTLTLKPIEKKAWLKYFAGIVNMQELVDGEMQSTFDASGARLELLESHLVEATGYTKEGEDIKAIAGWQSKLPMSHRRAAADLLVACEVVPVTLEEDTFPALGYEVVALKATWSEHHGRMQEQTGLTHIFRSPTAEHQKRYSRAVSRSVVVGGSRTGKTLWLGAQDVLIEIYDELIVETRGYLFPHDAFDPRHMDGYHKVAAAQALFTPVEIA